MTALAASPRLVRPPDSLTRLAGRVTADGRRQLGRVWPVVYRGLPAAAVTDGVAMKVLRGVRAPRVKSSERELSRQVETIATTRGRIGITVTRAQLVAFLADHSPHREPEVDPGYVAPGILLNRCVLRRFLHASLEAHRIEVRFTGPLDMVQLLAADWAVLIMPMRGDPERRGNHGPDLIGDGGSVPLLYRAESSGALALPNRDYGKVGAP